MPTDCPPCNFWWLFLAYGAIWVALVGYVASLFGRQKKLEREIEALRARRDEG